MAFSLGSKIFTAKTALLVTSALIGVEFAVQGKLPAANVEVLEPTQETITVPGGHGAATYEITDVQGISVGDLSSMVIEATGIAFTGTLTNPRLALQVSYDGGSTWVTTGTIYRNQALIVNESEGWTNRNEAYCNDNPVSGSTSALITVHDLNEASLMSIESIELSPIQANATQKHWAHMVVATAPVNAIRVGIFADSGTPVLTGGTLRVLGFSGRNTTVLSHDCTASPVSQIKFDVPQGYTLASLYGSSIGTSVSAAIGVRVGTGGTPDNGAADYYRQTKGADANVRANSSYLGLLAGTNTGPNHSGMARIFNLRTDAPVVSYSYYSTTAGSGSATRWDGVRRTITQRDQIFVECTAGTMNAGFIYCVMQKRSNKVTTHDFTASPAATVNLTGLTKKFSGMVMFCSHDLAMLSGSQSWDVRYGTPTIRTTTYLKSSLGENFTDNIAFVDRIGGTGPASGLTGFCINYGLPEEEMFSCVTHMGEIIPSSTFDNVDQVGWLQLAEAHSVLQFIGSTTINSGTGYFVEYRM